MNTEELVARIAAEEPPPTRFPRSPEKALLLWLALAGASVVAALVLLGPRADLAARLASPRYALQLALILAVTASSSAVAVLLAYPGRFRPALVLPALGTFTAAWLGALAALLAIDSRGTGLAVDAGYPCTLNALLVGVVPVFALLALVKAAAPTWPALNALAVGMAGFSVGAVVIHLHCVNDTALHQLVWHGTPLVAVAAACAALGWRLLRW